MKKLIFLLAIIGILIIGFLLIKNPIAAKNNLNGLNAYKAQDYNLAEKYFKNAAFWRRNNIEINLNLAKTLINLEKNEEAHSILKKIAALSSENPDYYALSGQLMIKKKEYENGLEFLNKAIKIDSLLSYAYYYRGIAKANLNDLSGAADDYSKAQKLDKSNIEALKMGTSLYVKLEDYNASIENYDKIIEAEPKNTDAFFQRGTFKMKINDYKGAIQDLSQAINLSPDHSEAYFNRGMAYAQDGNYYLAIVDFEQSLKRNFKMPASYYNSGLACLNLKKLNNAKTNFLNCTRIKENNEYIDDAFLGLGTIELMNNNFTGSIDYFNKSLTVNSENAETYYNRAIAYGYLKEYIKAIDDLNLCLNMGMTKAEVYFARGVHRISIHNTQEGCNDLKKALSMGYSAANDMIKIYCRN